MDYKRKIGEWIKQNACYDYYLGARFMNLFSNCQIVCKEINEAEIIYGSYVIMHLFIEGKSIYLSHYMLKKRDGSKDLIQEKLYHEYNNFFNLSMGYFKVTQYNMYALDQYIYSVKRKIDAGFARYSELLEYNIKSGSSGYLKIGINNAFSLDELKELIDAYNHLYSLLYYISEKGIEQVNQHNIGQVVCQYNMVLESIHIGSEGFLVSVGAGLIVEIIKAFVQAVYELNRSEADKRKQELISKVEMEADIATRQYIFQLINLLDSYLTKREQGYNNGVSTYIENEIDIIIRKIEKLQGTDHIDVVV